MPDTARDQYLLGLQSPWTVKRVNLDVTGQRVDVWAEHPEDAAWGAPTAPRRCRCSSGGPSKWASCCRSCTCTGWPWGISNWRSEGS